MKFRPLISILLISSIILLATGCGGGGGGGAAGDGFAVNYIVNGAESGAGPVGQYSHGEEVTISDNTGNLAKAGYLFDGWNTKADGTGKDYAPGAKYKGDELFLYAKWAPIYLYDIVDVGLPAPALDGIQKSPGDGVLSLRGLAPAGTRLSVFNIPSAIDGITVKYIASAAFQNNYNMISVTLPETLAVIGGSSFQGCINLTSLVLLGTTPPTLAGGALDGCPVTISVPVSAVDTYKAAGGWDSYSASITGPYTVTFNDLGATTPVSPTSKTVNPPVGTVGTLPTPPEKTCFTFGGWYTQTGGGGTQFTVSTPVTGDITVYAKWIFNPIYTERNNLAVGDIVLENGKYVSYSNYILAPGDYREVSLAAGVVAYLGETGTAGTTGNIYMVGLVNPSGAEWAIEDTTGYNTNFFTSETAGEGNWAVITTADPTGSANAATNYRAFNYANTYSVTGYTTGWFLPSRGEVCKLSDNMTTINNSINQIMYVGGGSGDVKPLPTSKNLWTSSQDSDNDTKAYSVGLNTGITFSTSKSSWNVNTVRAVRALD